MKIPSINTNYQGKSAEEILAELAGVMGTVQVAGIQNDINGRDNDYIVSQKMNEQWKQNLDKVEQEIQQYNEAVAAASEPEWKRVLMGIATLGLSEAIPALAGALTQALEKAGMPSSAAKVWGEVLAVAVVVVVVVATAGAASSAMADDAAAAAAANGSAAGGSSAATTSVSLAKVASFVAAMGLGSTQDVFPAIAHKLGLKGQAATYFAMALQITVCMVAGGYGAAGETGTMSAMGRAMASLPAIAQKAVSVSWMIEAGAGAAGAGYGIEQGIQSEKAAEAQDKMADHQSQATIYNAVMQMFVSGASSANDLLVTQMQASPLSEAKRLVDGYTVPGYLESQAV